VKTQNANPLPFLYVQETLSLKLNSASVTNKAAVLPKVTQRPLSGTRRQQTPAALSLKRTSAFSTKKDEE
jgi:hypothetical protein